MTPHPIPYQGSKRNLAAPIAALFPKNVKTLYEPFAGSAAMTLYAAQNGLAERFMIGDTMPQLVDLWRSIVFQPENVSARYGVIWQGQLTAGDDYFNTVRTRFNQEGDSVDLLYLIARCVKNAVRFNRQGKFTQSADRRRLGTRPDKMRKGILGASTLLKGKTEFHCGDFTETISDAARQDLVYMDPPYQGTTYGGDKRYYAQLESERLIDAILQLNAKGVPFLLSYDGTSGGKVYGTNLPEFLGMQHLLLNAGRSTQATLNGQEHTTWESLYISPYIELPSRMASKEGNKGTLDLFAAL